MTTAQRESIKHLKSLILDDEEANVKLLERILQREGFENIQGTTSPGQALKMYEYWKPDLLIVDLMMPEMDGFGVISKVHAQTPEGAYVPVLVITGDTSEESKERALSEGAVDFLTKPFSYNEVVLRVTNLLEARYLHLKLIQSKEMLEEAVRQRTAELEQRVRELTSLNTMFQQHLQERFSVVEAYKTMLKSLDEISTRVQEFRNQAYSQQLPDLQEVAGLGPYNLNNGQ